MYIIYGVGLGGGGWGPYFNNYFACGAGGAYFNNYFVCGAEVGGGWGPYVHNYLVCGAGGEGGAHLSIISLYVYV
jgi:hypothetical protein